MSIFDYWAETFGRPRPEKLVCVGLNYRDHAIETGAAIPAEPLVFLKLPSTIGGPGDPIQLDNGVGHVDAEAELAVVIGERASRVPAARALDVIAGYTVANDVSARDLQFAESQWFRGKSYDTFCPLLPKVVPTSELGEARGLRVVQRLNGETLQDSSTDELIFDVPALIEWITRVATLDRGDVILTGTPAGVGVARDPKVTLKAGDQVEVAIDGIGELANPVQARA